MSQSNEEDGPEVSLQENPFETDQETAEINEHFMEWEPELDLTPLIAEFEMSEKTHQDRPTVLEPAPDGMNGSSENPETVKNSESDKKTAEKSHTPAKLQKPAKKDTIQPAVPIIKHETSPPVPPKHVTPEKYKESQSEIEALKKKVEELSKNLDEAHDFIFSLQPRRQLITESEAAADYKSLCGSVEEWVQTKIGDAVCDKKLMKGSTAAAPARRFMSLISHPGREAFACPETDEYNVIAAIMNYLRLQIFDKDFYCPIQQGGIDFLNSIEDSMHNLEPQRDLFTRRSWRSETYIALASRQKFQFYRHRQTQNLVAELTAMLIIFLPGTDRAKLAASIETAIIEPALSLAHKLHLSVDKFTLEWTSFRKTRPENRSHDPSSFAAHECLDFLKAGKVVRNTNATNLTYLFDLAPSLVISTVKADAYSQPKVLSKPRVLVAVTKSEEGPFGFPDMASDEVTTLLGWLYNKLQKRTFQFR